MFLGDGPEVYDMYMYAPIANHTEGTIWFGKSTIRDINTRFSCIGLTSLFHPLDFRACMSN